MAVYRPYWGGYKKEEEEMARIAERGRLAEQEEAEKQKDLGGPPPLESMDGGQPARVQKREVKYGPKCAIDLTKEKKGCKREVIDLTGGGEERQQKRRKAVCGSMSSSDYAQWVAVHG